MENKMFNSHVELETFLLEEGYSREEITNVLHVMAKWNHEPTLGAFISCAKEAGLSLCYKDIDRLISSATAVKL